jgi:hypothetical protein
MTGDIAPDYKNNHSCYGSFSSLLLETCEAILTSATLPAPANAIIRMIAIQHGKFICTVAYGLLYEGAIKPDIA